MLQPGDLLHVGARDDNPVYVMGEVNKPLAVPPLRDGSLTLSAALSEAGQLNQQTSNAQQVFVLRKAADSEPVIFHLDLKSPVSMLLANQFPLASKDIVYVDNTGTREPRAEPVAAGDQCGVDRGARHQVIGMSTGRLRRRLSTRIAPWQPRGQMANQRITLPSPPSRPRADRINPNARTD